MNDPILQVLVAAVGLISGLIAAYMSLQKRPLAIEVSRSSLPWDNHRVVMSAANSAKGSSVSTPMLQHHRRLLIAILTLLLAGLTACQSSSGDPTKITTVSSPAFHVGLNHLMESPDSTLVSIHYWDAWQAVVINRKTNACSAYSWDGVAFKSANNSPVIRADICSDVYSPLEPLGGNHISASVEYKQALDGVKGLRRDPFGLFFPVPALMAITIDGRLRPIWILPYKRYFHDGFIGVLADSAEVVESVTYQPRQHLETSGSK